MRGTDLALGIMSKPNRRSRTCTAASLAFPLQRPLVTSRSRRDIAVLPRQAGKTTAAALRALHVAQQPKAERVTYIAATRGNAKRLFWRPLLKWAEKCGIDTGECANLSDLTLKVEHADGTYCLIELLGAHDQAQIDLLRGTQYDLVIVDEAGYIRAHLLESLLNEVIVPGCRVRQGAILLIGTPGPVKGGPFYEAFASGRWSPFNWTAHDNPATPAGSIEEEVRQLGLKETDPRYIREYLAQWCDGLDESMVWQYVAGRNDPDIVLPEHWRQPGFESWRYSWGIDLASSNDCDALVVWGWDDNDGERRIYEVDSWQAPGTELIDELEAALQGKRAQWQPSCAIGDTGGHGAKKILNTLAPRLNIVFQDKPTDVEATVRLMNTDLRTSRMRVKRGGALAADMAMEQWEVDPKTLKRKIGGVRHSDLTAAGRYGYAASLAHRAVAEMKLPTDPRERVKAERTAQIIAAAKARAKGAWRS